MGDPGQAGGLGGYVAKRLLGMLLILAGVTFVVFGMMYLAPGDVTVMLAASSPSPEQVAAIRREFGLDQPPWVQYGMFLGRVAQGDLGDSWIDRRPVMPQVLDAFGYTLRLAAAALALSVILGTAGGILSAVRHRSVTDEDHPGHAEAVGDHAEARREEGLGERHLHLPALAQRPEHPLGLGLVGDRERQREALEAGLPHAAAIGGQHRRVADPQAHVHHLLGAARRIGLRLGIVLEAHHHLDLGAERAAIELGGLLAAAVEEQVRLDLHRLSPRLQPQRCAAVLARSRSSCSLSSGVSVSPKSSASNT